MISKIKLKQFFKEYFFIVVIVFLAFILRIWGVAYGLPGLFVGDEKSIVGGALKMMYERNIFPVLAPDTFRLLYYPVLIPWICLIFFVPWSFFVYLTGDFVSVSALRDHFTLNPEAFFLIARLINVFFSTAIIFLIYVVGKKIFSYRAGVLAALIYAVSYLPIHQGHFVKHWNVGGFMAVFVLYFAFLILKNPCWRNYIWAGVFIGLAGFSDYVHVVYGLIIAFVHFFVLKLSLKEKFLSRKFWTCVLIAIIIFIIIGILTYPQEFQRLVLGEDSTATAVKSVTGLWQVVSEVIMTLFNLETVLFILSILGGLFLFFRDKKLFLVFIFIPVLSPFLYYFILHFEPRYVLLFLPILGILAGHGLDRLISLLKIKSIFLIILFSLVVISLPLRNAIIFDKIISQTDTRILAKNWIESNIPYGSKIIINSWEFNLIRNSDCIYDQQQANNISLRTRDYVMWSQKFENSYCVWPLDLVLKLPADFKNYLYYVTDDETIYSAQRPVLDGELIPHMTLIKEFEGRSLSLIENYSHVFLYKALKNNKLGPTVKIYKLDFNSGGN